MEYSSDYGFLPYMGLKTLGKIKMNNKKSLNKQQGGTSALMLMMIIGAVGYSAYVAKNKGLISYDKATSFVSSVSSKLSASDDFSGYGVQLMATKQLDQAKTVMNDFARDGYSAFVVASQSKGRTLYKVRLGPYGHRPEAVAIQDKVVRRYPQNPYVKSSLVIYKPN